MSFLSPFFFLSLRSLLFLCHNLSLPAAFLLLYKLGVEDFGASLSTSPLFSSLIYSPLSFLRFSFYLPSISLSRVHKICKSPAVGCLIPSLHSRVNFITRVWCSVRPPLPMPPPVARRHTSCSSCSLLHCIPAIFPK